MTEEKKNRVLGVIESAGFHVLNPIDSAEIKTFDQSVPPKTVIQLFGIEETKDVARVFCLTANNLVNGESFLSIEFGKAAIQAGSGIKEVRNELLDLDAKEAIELYEFVADNLKFKNPDQQKVEILAEKITSAVLTVIAGIVEYNS
jgi:hypothetical protein